MLKWNKKKVLGLKTLVIAIIKIQGAGCTIKGWISSYIHAAGYLLGECRKGSRSPRLRKYGHKHLVAPFKRV